MTSSPYFLALDESEQKSAFKGPNTVKDEEDIDISELVQLNTTLDSEKGKPAKVDAKDCDCQKFNATQAKNVTLTKNDDEGEIPPGCSWFCRQPYAKVKENATSEEAPKPAKEAAPALSVNATKEEKKPAKDEKKLAEKP